MRRIRSVHSRSDDLRLIVTVRHYERIATVDEASNTPIGRLRFFALINRRVLRRCMHSSWISIKLTCIDTNPLVSLDSILFLFQFRIHGGVEIKIWWKIEREIAA